MLSVKALPEQKFGALVLPETKICRLPGNFEIGKGALRIALPYCLAIEG